MDKDATLVRRLGALTPPDIDLARERAVGTVPGRVRAESANRSNRLSHASPRLASALAAALLALTAFSLLTPPGHAFTSWVGDRLGFGESGGPPTLRDLRAFATEGSAGEGQPAYVLLRGPAPGIGHYELITYRTKDEPGKLWPANGARCFELDFPEARAIGGPTCGLPPAEHGVRFAGVGGGSSQAGGYYHHASGRVSDDVDSVDVKFNGEPVAAELTPIPGDLIERFQIRRPFKFFIAFLDHSRHGGIVTVTARDAAGQAVARRRARLPDFARMEELRRRLQR